MSMMRGVILVAGLGLIAAAGIAALQLQTAPPPVQTASSKAPVADEAVQPGRFLQAKWHGFPISQPATYEFTPSAATRDLANRYEDGGLLAAKIWYEYAPKTEGPMPLVILLHGAGRDGLSLIEMWSEVAKQNGLAVLAPDGIGGNWPLNRPDPDGLQKMIAQMRTRHNIDPERIYLFGHSNGAAYAQVLLNGTTGPWRAAVLHAGFVSADMLIQSATPKPFRLYIGEHEHIFSLEEAITNGQEAARRGHDNDLVVIPGHTHWLYDAGPQIAGKSWNWLQDAAH